MFLTIYFTFGSCKCSGYMSPEYAMEGLFSVKSDVYSFGVLLLEIISGKRNTSLRSSEHGSLIGYVSLTNQIVDRLLFSLSVNDQIL